MGGRGREGSGTLEVAQSWAGTQVQGEEIPVRCTPTALILKTEGPTGRLEVGKKERGEAGKRPGKWQIQSEKDVKREMYEN